MADYATLQKQNQVLLRNKAKSPGAKKECLDKSECKVSTPPKDGAILGGWARMNYRWWPRSPHQEPCIPGQS